MIGKKGVSEIISYVILVVIALTMSVVVFGFLETQIPKTPETCPGELSLILKNYECQVNNEIDLTFQNKGNFKIDGVYVKYSDDSARASTFNLVTDRNIDASSNEITHNEGYNGFLYFGRGAIPLALNPNRDYIHRFSYIAQGALEKIQIQPFILNDEDELIICEERTISHTISCS